VRSRRLQRVEGRKLRVETAKDMNIFMVFWLSNHQAIFSPRLGLLSTLYLPLSTLYSLLSTLYFLIPWLLGLFAFSRLLQRDGRWAEIEPVRNRLIKECRQQGMSKLEAQAWTYSELNRTNVNATYPEPKQDKRPKGESITSSSASWPSVPLYQTTSRSPSCLAPVLQVGRMKTDLRHENRSRRPRC